MDTTEKRFESDIEASFHSPAGGYTKGTDTYDPSLGLYVSTLISFVQATQPKEWARFEKQNQVDPVRKFCMAFNSACEMDGLLSVLTGSSTGASPCTSATSCRSPASTRPPPSGMPGTRSSATANGTTPPTRRNPWTWCWPSTASRFSPLS